MSDTGIVLNRMMEITGNSVDVIFSVDFMKTYYQAAKYIEFQKFYKNIFEIFNEQVVIKKKRS
jgi:hypothetical protein